MPSKARTKARDKMLPEIRHLVECHRELRQGAKGPDKHNSILRSSVVLLCAAWEMYCESVVLESTFKLMRVKNNVDDLSESIKIQLKQAVHDSEMIKSDPLKLAGTGWKRVHIDTVRERCQRLNTPKSQNIDQLFLQSLGIRGISSSWSCGAQEIDTFVTFRGEIAHRGSDASRINRDQVIHYLTIVTKSISETDDRLYSFFKDSSVSGKAPWRRTS